MLFYEQDEETRFLYEEDCLPTEISKNASKRLKSLNAETLKKM